MSRLPGSLLLAAVAILGLACGGGGGNSPTTPSTNLSGIVHELNPPVFTRIPGAAVSIQGRSTTTDANGEFRFTDLQPGATILTLSKTGFRTRDQPLTLHAGENTTSQEMLPAP